MRFADLSNTTRTLWAKSGEPKGHGLVTHLLDVAAVAEAILDRESPQTRNWVARSFGLPVADVPRWLATLAGLHDFGKAISGFQAKWPTGQALDKAAGMGFPPIALRADRHDLAGGALLWSEFERRFPGTIWAMAMAQILAAHHGYVHRTRELRDEKAKLLGEGPEWAAARGQLLDAYLHTLQPGDPPTQEEIPLPALVWLAGLTSVADWIGSNQDWFPPGERADLLIDHHVKALELAERALDEIGWPRYQPLLTEALDTHVLLGRVMNRPGVEARPLQQAAERLLNQARGPVLMIVEAPMGEGKTELAFLAHLRLQARNGHRGLYVALPTQATSNAMFERTSTFLRGFSSHTPLDLQLAHGGARLSEPVHRLQGINHSEGDSIASSAWFSQRKRPLLSPYGVGTVDQALFAILNVKHHFVRLWGLANRVVVLDEVHAYDTYTSGLIEALLRWLKAMNCSVVLMSATLPDHRRAELLRTWESGKAPEIPYPRVLLAEGGQIRGEPVSCRQLAPIQVSGLAEDLPSLADVALERLTEGGCGLVIVNTVQRAQSLYASLKGRMEGELLLFHARYPANERALREALVLQRFGQGEACRRPERALLIATQVVEQSLDLDFDFMISDLAPVDLLLQRAGRLHRHQRERPEAHRIPRLIIVGFQQERLPELIETAWGFVYDPYVLYRTWAIAGPESLWQLPGDIDRLVQAVYSSEPFVAEDREEYLKPLDLALGKHLAMVQEQRQHARNLVLDAESDLANAYLTKPRANEAGEGEGLQVVTRLGDPGLLLVPVHVEAGGWCLVPGDPPFDPMAELDDELARRMYHRQLRVSRKDLVLALLNEPAIPAFQSHPLLRDLRPLPLREGVAEFGSLRVRLDPELGLIYETTTKEER